MNPQQLTEMAKNEIPNVAQTLSIQDVAFLVCVLSEKDDKLRYTAFLLLQAHSKLHNTVYGHWDVLAQKLGSDNSYQRSIGVMLLAENVRWDNEGRFGAVLDKFLVCCVDEKFITSRQTLQALMVVMQATNKYSGRIADAVGKLSFCGFKDNQQKLLLKDAAAVLKAADKSLCR